MLDLNLKKVFWWWLNGIALGAIFILMVNFSMVQWSWNPVVDFLYGRTLGPEFYLNHYVSGIAVCATMLYFSIKERNPFKSSVVILSIVSIHEIAYEFILYPVKNALPVQYVVILSMYLCLGLFVANKSQRFKLGIIALVVVTYMLFWVDFLIASGHNSYTILGLSNGSFIPGPMYYDPIDAIIEITSWLLPLALWYLPMGSSKAVLQVASSQPEARSIPSSFSIWRYLWSISPSHCHSFCCPSTPGKEVLASQPYCKSLSSELINHTER